MPRDYGAARGQLQDVLGDSAEDLWCRSRHRFTLCSGPPIRPVLDNMSATGTWLWTGASSTPGGYVCPSEGSRTDGALVGHILIRIGKERRDEATVFYSRARAFASWQTTPDSRPTSVLIRPRDFRAHRRFLHTQSCLELRAHGVEGREYYSLRHEAEDLRARYQNLTY